MGTAAGHHWCSQPVISEQENPCPGRHIIGLKPRCVSVVLSIDILFDCKRVT